MKGFPSRFKTVADLEAGIEFALQNEQSKARMIKALEDIRDSVMVKRLKESSIPEDEETPFVPTDDDFEMVEDPNAVLYRLGLTADDIEKMIARLQ